MPAPYGFHFSLMHRSFLLYSLSQIVNIGPILDKHRPLVGRSGPGEKDFRVVE